MGKWEDQLNKLAGDVDWDLTDADLFKSALQDVADLFNKVAGEPGVEGTSRDAAQELFSQMAKSTLEVKQWVTDLQTKVKAGNDLKNEIQGEIDQLPSAEVDPGTKAGILAGSTLLGGPAGLAASGLGLGWYENHLAEEREAKAEQIAEKYATKLDNHGTSLQTSAEAPPKFVVSDYPPPPTPPAKQPAPYPTGSTGGGLGTGSSSYHQVKGQLIVDEGTFVGPTWTTPVDPTPPVDETPTPTIVDETGSLVSDGDTDGTTTLPGGLNGSGSTGSSALTGGMFGAGSAAALAAGSRMTGGGLGAFGAGGGFGGGGLAGGGAAGGAGGRSFGGGGIGEAGRAGGRPGSGRGLLGGMSAEEAAARSASGARSGGAGGPAGGMMGGGGGAAGGGKDGRKKRGLGGPQAPRLEDEEEFGPLSSGAAAGGRDDE